MIGIRPVVIMRQPSTPSTAQCNSTLYTLFLLSEPKYVSCVRISEVLEPLSHDSVNRFLLRERYTRRDLFDEVKGHLIWSAGTLSVGDSVEDKPYRDPSKSAFVDYFWSGKHKRSVKGINLITLYSRFTTLIPQVAPTQSILDSTTNRRGRQKTTTSERWYLRSFNGGLSPLG